MVNGEQIVCLFKFAQSEKVGTYFKALVGGSRRGRIPFAPHRFCVAELSELAREWRNRLPTAFPIGVVHIDHPREQYCADISLPGGHNKLGVLMSEPLSLAGFCNRDLPVSRQQLDRVPASESRVGGTEWNTVFFSSRMILSLPG